jgi:hypothetical protein
VHRVVQMVVRVGRGFESASDLERRESPSDPAKATSRQNAGSRLPPAGSGLTGCLGVGPTKVVDTNESPFTGRADKAPIRKGGSWKRWTTALWSGEYSLPCSRRTTSAVSSSSRRPVTCRVTQTRRTSQLGQVDSDVTAVRHLR